MKWAAKKIYFEGFLERCVNPPDADHDMDDEAEIDEPKPTRNKRRRKKGPKVE